MTLGERIRKLRREKDLTQEEFCKRIGLKRNSISLVESGKRNISDQAIFSICREFNVNEEWLRNGTGELFKAAPSDSLDALAQEYHLSHGDYIVIEKFLKLKSEHRAAIIDYFREVSAALASDDTPSDFPAYSEKQPNITTIGVLEAESEYEKSSGYVQAMGLSASSTTQDMA